MDGTRTRTADVRALSAAEIVGRRQRCRPRSHHGLWRRSPLALEQIASKVFESTTRLIRAFRIHIQIDVGDPALFAGLPPATLQVALQETDRAQFRQRDVSPPAARRQSVTALAAGLPGERDLLAGRVPQDDHREHARTPSEDASDLLFLDHRSYEE